ncbi:MAG TPA: hypothetical protein VFK89_06335 [Actinomycetota bacterium]|nr:hypothetical protein [Actinomycetota bacterium]
MADAPISWMTLESGTRITTADGDEVGKVHEVIADRQKDIFSGVTFRDGLLSGIRFVSAELISAITTDEVRLSIPSAEAEDKIQPYDG